MTSPFKFLDSYTREDRAIFFGRDQEITELYRRVFESRILLVYGISGTGKSSLINCGLASRFDESDWLPVNVRRGNNIIESLNEAINKQAISPLKKNLTITERLQSVYLDHFKPVYLVFDQFEELFIFGTQEERTTLIKLIKEIFLSKSQCRIILVIREEFLAEISGFEEELPEIFSNRFRVEKMKRANAILAVEGPCKVHDIKTEAGFSEELVDKLIPSGQEIELTFLQIYLDRIFRLATVNFPHSQGGMKGGYSFTIALLERAGSVSDLLGQFLEEQIREMDDPETGMAILKSFVSVQGTKKQMTEKEIQDSIGAFGKVITEPDLLKYLTKFVDLRILRERDEAGHFELRHDALAGKIYEQFTITEKELLEVRQYVENAFQAFNTRKTYLNHDDLDYLSIYEKRLFLPAPLSRFIQDSKDRLQSQQKALRRLTSLVAVVFLIIVGAGIKFYLNQKGSSQTKELTVLALLQEKVSPLTAINTAFKVRGKDSVTVVIQGVILNSFYQLLKDRIERGDTSLPSDLLPREIPVTGTVLSMRLNKTGSHLFGWTDKKELFVSIISDRTGKSFKVDDDIEIAELSDNGLFLAVVYKNCNGEVYTTDGNKLFDFRTNVNQLMNERLVRFFPSGKFFLAVTEDSKVAIYDSTGNCIHYLTGHTGRVNSLDISPDGRFVATASCDNKAIIWNFNHNTQEFKVYNSLIGHKDTVWSCEFNKTGKYLLTASADSLLNIWNLKGELQYVVFLFISNSINRSCNWTPRYEPRLRKPERHFDFMPEYYQKAYDARFATGKGVIVASNYKYGELKNSDPDKIFRTQVLYWDYMGFEGQNITESYNMMAQEESDSLLYHSYKSWEVAAGNKMFAAVFNDHNEILLIAPGGYHMLSLPGTFPEFLNDGKYLYYVHDNNIHMIPLDLKEIHSMVFEKNIFGDPGGSDDIWKIL